MQERLEKMDVFRKQANFRLESDLKDGDTVKRVYRSNIVPAEYTRGSDVTFKDITDTAESLTVDKTPVLPFYVDDLDAIQSHYDTREQYTADTVKDLNHIIDGYYLAEVTNATNTIDAADFGGTAAQAATITPANIQKMFALAQKKLARRNVKMGNMFANLTPDVYQTLLEYLAGKESVLGDRTGENGSMGKYFGFDLFVSNATYWTGRLNLATQPTANDTIVFNGVTITFVSSIGSTAGNVLIGANVDATRVNLAALFNAPGTTNSTQVALANDDQVKFYGLTATDVPGSDWMNITYRGAGGVVVSDTLTDTTDGWSTTLCMNQLMFGEKGAVDFVIQKQPTVQIEKAEARLGYKVIPYTLFGKKTFQDGAKKLVNVKVNTFSYT
ncbi:MAG: hypothetical protein AB1757_06815 [Acidobacteriota bacterium]